jgi:hypothetical protein
MNRPPKPQGAPEVSASDVARTVKDPTVPVSADTDPRTLPAIIPLQDASRLLRIGKNRVYGMVRDGSYPVPVTEDAGRFRVRKTDLLAYLGYQVSAA